MSTLTSADIYGPQNPRTRQPVSMGQSTGRATSAATGILRDTPQAAMFWLGLVVLLVAMRILIERNGF